MKFRIIPEISIDADRRSVNFGVITYEGGRVCGNQQLVVFNYSVLKDARCEISSENSFNLKNKNGGDYISYSFSVDHQEVTDTRQDRKIILLDSGSNIFSVTFDPSGYRKSIPTAGDYADYVTFTLIPD
jgi:hypothetical protein